MLDAHFKSTLLLVAVVINTIVFVILSMLHFYWAFGGRYWYEDVLPTSSNGLNRMNPGMAATIIVAVGLLFFAVITIGNHGVFSRYTKTSYFGYGALAISILFLLRAIGDFRLVGFFKTILATRFATNDTLIFSPLCLFISLLSLLLFLSNKNR